MTSRLLAASLGLVFVVTLAVDVRGQDQDPASAKKSRTTAGPSKKGNQARTRPSPDASDTELPKWEKATFGGGCFWCTEAVFQRVPGVRSVVSGYAGGNVPFPSYEQVCSGLTGHAEVIQVVFDPAVVGYDKLLNIFFKSHDPTTLNAQGPDFGTQYRSIILYHSEDQKKAAQAKYQELTKAKAFRGRIVTELVPFTEFYPAEDYHQNYFNNHPYADYSQTYIVPKVQKFLKDSRPKTKASSKKASKPATRDGSAKKGT
jgi:peptide-methionine (S)-S-oxide reductase